MSMWKKDQQMDLLINRTPGLKLNPKQCRMCGKGVRIKVNLENHMSEEHRIAGDFKEMREVDLSLVKCDPCGTGDSKEVHQIEMNEVRV